MFGESESESPRSGSPWDSLVSETATPFSADEGLAKLTSLNVPKLVPEVEQGNVEYKLKLVNPSSERFARLVTQLKWRLLEGGGQAFYELGVADSGQLVGLSRTNLELSLQTLEEMAGEIGASVIVVKEIEIPAVMINLATKWQTRTDGAMRMPKKRVEECGDALTEGEDTELSTPEADDDLELDIPSPLRDNPRVLSPNSFRSHPDRPTAQSSPMVFPMDDDSESDIPSVDLEISSVYKPRPTRKRTSDVSDASSGRTGNASPPMNIPKANNKRRPWQDATTLAANKDAKRKLKEWNPSAKGRKGSLPKIIIEKDENMKAAEDAVSALVPSLEALHVSVKENTIVTDCDLETPSLETEKRVMVEVLVVRKMSLEEGFLDFGGFSDDIELDQFEF